MIVLDVILNYKSENRNFKFFFILGINFISQTRINGYALYPLYPGVSGGKGDGEGGVNSLLLRNFLIIISLYHIISYFIFKRIPLAHIHSHKLVV